MATDLALAVRDARPPAALLRVTNPILKTLLRTPVSRVIRPLALIEFRGRRSGRPIRVVVAWHVNPGQRIAAHVHPHGQDTWTVLSGSGEYQLEHNGRSQTISPGCVVVAPTGCVHGVFNCNNEPLVFISVVCPAEAGYELA